MSFTESNTVERMIISVACGRRQPSPPAPLPSERTRTRQAMDALIGPEANVIVMTGAQAYGYIRQYY